MFSANAPLSYSTENSRKYYYALHINISLNKEKIKLNVYSTIRKERLFIKYQSIKNIIIEKLNIVVVLFVIDFM